MTKGVFHVARQGLLLPLRREFRKRALGSFASVEPGMGKGRWLVNATA